MEAIYILGSLKRAFEREKKKDIYGLFNLEKAYERILREVGTFWRKKHVPRRYDEVIKECTMEW